MARGRAVWIVGERSVGAREAAVVVHAGAVREASWRAGGTVVARRGEPRTAALDPCSPATTRTRPRVVRVDCGRVVVGYIEPGFIDPIDVSVGTGPWARRRKVNERTGRERKERKEKKRKEKEKKRKKRGRKNNEIERGK